MPNRALIFVYNADSGFFNTLADIAHKITSPQTYECKLCLLTHDAFAMKKAWRTFVANNRGVELRFYHRDEFREAYPNQSEALPAVFVETDVGIRTLIDRERLEKLEDVGELIGLVESVLGDGVG